MKKIPSFSIDHTRLEPGVYVSRRDVTPAGEVLTTFDVRMTRPNREAALTPEALHAMEHLAATFLRNDEEWSPRIVYWGPMGCCTGNYLIVQGEVSPRQIVELLRRTMTFIAGFEGEVPGATPRDCGNYSFMDLAEARAAALRFIDVLDHATDQNFSYPAE